MQSDTKSKMASFLATDYANLHRALREMEELRDVAEQENSALRARVAALEAALAARDGHKAEENDKWDEYENDSEWDCSCATPEMCRGGCCTSEDFKDWNTEEKVKGVVHEQPLHDFKIANRGVWGIERRLKRAELDVQNMEKYYLETLENASTDSFNVSMSKDELERAKNHVAWYKEVLEKERAAS